MKNTDLLSEQQTKVLHYIIAFRSEHDYGPTYQEIGTHLGVSRARAEQHVRRLQVYGWTVTAVDSAHRAVDLTPEAKASIAQDNAFWCSSANEETL